MTTLANLVAISTVPGTDADTLSVVAGLRNDLLFQIGAPSAGGLVVSGLVASGHRPAAAMAADLATLGTAKVIANEDALTQASLPVVRTQPAFAADDNGAFVASPRTLEMLLGLLDVIGAIAMANLGISVWDGLTNQATEDVSEAGLVFAGQALVGASGELVPALSALQVAVQYQPLAIEQLDAAWTAYQGLLSTGIVDPETLSNFLATPLRTCQPGSPTQGDAVTQFQGLLQDLNAAARSSAGALVMTTETVAGYAAIAGLIGSAATVYPTVTVYTIPTALVNSHTVYGLQGVANGILDQLQVSLVAVKPSNPSDLVKIATSPPGTLFWSDGPMFVNQMVMSGASRDYYAALAAFLGRTVPYASSSALLSVAYDPANASCVLFGQGAIQGPADASSLVTTLTNSSTGAVALVTDASADLIFTPASRGAILAQGIERTLGAMAVAAQYSPELSKALGLLAVLPPAASSAFVAVGIRLYFALAQATATFSHTGRNAAWSIDPAHFPLADLDLSGIAYATVEGVSVNGVYASAFDGSVASIDAFCAMPVLTIWSSGPAGGSAVAMLVSTASREQMMAILRPLVAFGQAAFLNADDATQGMNSAAQITSGLTLLATANPWGASLRTDAAGLSCWHIPYGVTAQNYFARARQTIDSGDPAELAKLAVGALGEVRIALDGSALLMTAATSAAWIALDATIVVSPLSALWQMPIDPPAGSLTSRLAAGAANVDVTKVSGVNTVLQSDAGTVFVDQSTLYMNVDTKRLFDALATALSAPSTALSGVVSYPRIGNAAAAIMRELVLAPDLLGPVTGAAEYTAAILAAPLGAALYERDLSGNVLSLFMSPDTRTFLQQVLTANAETISSAPAAGLPAAVDLVNVQLILGTMQVLQPTTPAGSQWSGYEITEIPLATQTGLVLTALAGVDPALSDSSLYGVVTDAAGRMWIGQGTYFAIINSLVLLVRQLEVAANCAFDEALSVGAADGTAAYLWRVASGDLFSLSARQGSALRNAGPLSGVQDVLNLLGSRTDIVLTDQLGRPVMTASTWQSLATEARLSGAAAIVRTLFETGRALSADDALANLSTDATVWHVTDPTIARAMLATGLVVLLKNPLDPDKLLNSDRLALAGNGAGGPFVASDGNGGLLLSGAARSVLDQMLVLPASLYTEIPPPQDILRLTTQGLAPLLAGALGAIYAQYVTPAGQTEVISPAAMTVDQQTFVAGPLNPVVIDAAGGILLCGPALDALRGRLAEAIGLAQVRLADLAVARMQLATTTSVSVSGVSYTLSSPEGSYISWFNVLDCAGIVYWIAGERVQENVGTSVQPSLFDPSLVVGEAKVGTLAVDPLSGRLVGSQETIALVIAQLRLKGDVFRTQLSAILANAPWTAELPPDPGRYFTHLVSNDTPNDPRAAANSARTVYAMYTLARSLLGINFFSDGRLKDKFAKYVAGELQPAGVADYEAAIGVVQGLKANWVTKTKKQKRETIVSLKEEDGFEPGPGKASPIVEFTVDASQPLVTAAAEELRTLHTASSRLRSIGTAIDGVMSDFDVKLAKVIEWIEARGIQHGVDKVLEVTGREIEASVGDPTAQRISVARRGMREIVEDAHTALNLYIETMLTSFVIKALGGVEGDSYRILATHLGTEFGDIRDQVNVDAQGFVAPDDLVEDILNQTASSGKGKGKEKPIDWSDFKRELRRSLSDSYRNALEQTKVAVEKAQTEVDREFLASARKVARLTAQQTPEARRFTVLDNLRNGLMFGRLLSALFSIGAIGGALSNVAYYRALLDSTPPVEDDPSDPVVHAAYLERKKNEDAFALNITYSVQLIASVLQIPAFMVAERIRTQRKLSRIADEVKHGESPLRDALSRKQRTGHKVTMQKFTAQAADSMRRDAKARRWRRKYYQRFSDLQTVSIDLPKSLRLQAGKTFAQRRVNYSSFSEHGLAGRPIFAMQSLSLTEERRTAINDAINKAELDATGGKWGLLRKRKLQFFSNVGFLLADLGGIALAIHQLVNDVNEFKDSPSTVLPVQMTGSAVGLVQSTSFFVGDSLSAFASYAALARFGNIFLAAGYLMGLVTASISLGAAATQFDSIGADGSGRRAAALAVSGATLNLVATVVFGALVLEFPPLGVLMMLLPDLASVGQALDLQDAMDEASARNLTNDSEALGALHTVASLNAAPLVNLFAWAYQQGIYIEQAKKMDAAWCQATFTQRVNATDAATNAQQQTLFEMIQGRVQNNPDMADAYLIMGRVEDMRYPFIVADIRAMKGALVYHYGEELLSAERLGPYFYGDGSGSLSVEVGAVKVGDASLPVEIDYKDLDLKVLVATGDLSNTSGKLNYYTIFPCETLDLSSLNSKLFVAAPYVLVDASGSSSDSANIFEVGDPRALIKGGASANTYLMKQAMEPQLDADGNIFAGYIYNIPSTAAATVDFSPASSTDGVSGVTIHIGRDYAGQMPYIGVIAFKGSAYSDIFTRYGGGVEDAATIVSAAGGGSSCFDLRSGNNTILLGNGVVHFDLDNDPRVALGILSDAPATLFSSGFVAGRTNSVGVTSDLLVGGRFVSVFGHPLSTDTVALTGLGASVVLNFFVAGSAIGASYVVPADGFVGRLVDASGNPQGEPILFLDQNIDTFIGGSVGDTVVVPQSVDGIAPGIRTIIANSGADFIDVDLGGVDVLSNSGRTQIHFRQNAAGASAWVQAGNTLVIDTAGVAGTSVFVTATGDFSGATPINVDASGASSDVGCELVRGALTLTSGSGNTAVTVLPAAASLSIEDNPARVGTLYIQLYSVATDLAVSIRDLSDYSGGVHGTPDQYRFSILWTQENGDETSIIYTGHDSTLLSTVVLKYGTGNSTIENDIIYSTLDQYEAADSF